MTRSIKLAFRAALLSTVLTALLAASTGCDPVDTADSSGVAAVKFEQRASLPHIFMRL